MGLHARHPHLGVKKLSLMLFPNLTMSILGPEAPDHLCAPPLRLPFGAERCGKLVGPWQGSPGSGALPRRLGPPQRVPLADSPDLRSLSSEIKSRSPPPQWDGTEGARSRFLHDRLRRVEVRTLGGREDGRPTKALVRERPKTLRPVS